MKMTGLEYQPRFVDARRLEAKDWIRNTGGFDVPMSTKDVLRSRRGLFGKTCTPWRMTGEFTVSSGIFGRLTISVTEERFVVELVFQSSGIRRWRREYRIRTARYADLPAIQRKIKEMGL